MRPRLDIDPIKHLEWNRKRSKMFQASLRELKRRHPQEFQAIFDRLMELDQ